MASIRLLKKDINRLAFNLLSECFAIKHYNKGVSDDEYDAVIKKIVYLRNDLISRANHPEQDAETSSIKDHYKSVQKDLIDLFDVVENLKKNAV